MLNVVLMSVFSLNVVAPSNSLAYHDDEEKVFKTLTAESHSRQLPQGGAALVQDELPLLLAPHQGHGQERDHLHGRGRGRRETPGHLPPAQKETGSPAR